MRAPCISNHAGARAREPFVNEWVRDERSALHVDSEADGPVANFILSRRERRNAVVGPTALAPQLDFKRVVAEVGLRSGAQGQQAVRHLLAARTDERRRP